MFSEGKAKYSLRLFVEIDVYNDSYEWKVGERDKRKGARTDKHRVIASGLSFSSFDDNKLIDLIYQEGMPGVIVSTLSAIAYHARLAQMAEHHTRKVDAAGSIPASGLEKSQSRRS